jgi:hypothetical protein
MNCTECIEKFVEYIEGLLPDEQKQSVKLHLDDCAQCRSELDELTALGKRIASDSKSKQSADFEDAVFNRIIREQNLRLKQADKISRQLEIVRMIMKSKITKLAAAAVIIIAAVLSVNIFNKTIPTAFGIEQIIEAYNNIRFLHVKQYRTIQEEPVEAWIKADQQGGIEKARYYLPEYIAPEDGAKLIAWTPQRAELWFKRKNGYLIFQTKKVEPMMKNMIEQCQPKIVLEKLLNDQKSGTVDINMQEPNDKQKPAVIVATYKSSPKKEVYYINQATNLITHIEYYSIENGRGKLASTTEFYDYNVPIDEKMFSLKDEVPKDVMVVNQLEQLIGIPQGNMTDEQAAAETVRQFFQAMIDKDYKKAGQIYSGISEEKMKEIFEGKLNVTAIISIGTPTPYPKCGPHSFRVPCELEITGTGGQKTTWKPYGPFVRCGDDEMHPDRWIIHGGI